MPQARRPVFIATLMVPAKELVVLRQFGDELSARVAALTPGSERYPGAGVG